MTFRMDDASRDAANDAINGLIDDGTGDAKLQLWSGAKPGSLGGAPAGDLLAEFTLPVATNGPFGASSGGTAAVNQANVDPATGLAAAGAGTEVGFARVVSRDGVVRSDNDDVDTSGTQIVLNTTTISEGVDVTLESWTRTMPAS